MRRFLLISLAFYPAALFSQKYLPFEFFTQDQGLSQNSVNCILKDQQGFIWFGTSDGLNRYDGYEFVIFKNNPSDSFSLPDNFILSLAQSAPDVIWIGIPGACYPFT